MNQQYDNTNRGVLFPNSRKTKENHPDYTGKIDIEGTEHWLSAWLKKSKNGNQFISISLGEVIEDKPAEAPTTFPSVAPLEPLAAGTASKNSGPDFEIDDIPF